MHTHLKLRSPGRLSRSLDPEASSVREAVAPILTESVATITSMP